MADLGDALATDLQAIDDKLDAELDAIDTNARSQQIAALQGALDAGRERARARDEASRRGTLADAAAETDAQVARMQDVLARVRTESERVAATALLDKALAAQRAAAGELQAFDEAAGLDAVERTIGVLQAQQEAERTANREAADQAKRDRQTIYDDQVREETTRHDALVATLQRQLGDLSELIRQNTPTSRKAAAELVGAIGETLDAPEFRAAFADSGEELGLAFSRGLARAEHAVDTSAKALAAAVAKYLRLRSPAEAGPLAHDFARSGAVIPLDLVRGMRSGREAVEAEARRLAAAAALATAVSGAAVGGPSGTVASGGVQQAISFHVENPVEDMRSWAERAAWSMRVVAGGGR